MFEVWSIDIVGGGKMVILFGYTRVSSEKQKLDRQFVAIGEYKQIPINNMFCDKITGKTDDRVQYNALKVILQNLATINNQKELKDRDSIELVIEELDRLGRTKKIIRDEMEWFNKLGIKLRILEIPTTLIEIDAENDWVLDMVNKILIEVYTALAEQELVKKEKRTREGIELAKAKGLYKGRKPIEVDPDQWKKVYDRWRKGELTARKSMDLLNLKPNTFYRIVKQYENKIAI